MNTNKPTPWPLSIALVFCAASVLAAKPDFSKAAAILEKGIQDGAYPGCTIVVGNEDKILWSQAFGHMEYSDKEPVTKDTLYDLASLTKVTGPTSVMMRLVQLSKIDIHDPVAKYLPEFVDLAPAGEKETRKKITVEHLLTHTAGLTPDPSGRAPVKSYQELIQLDCRTPLQYEPGADCVYSDISMMLAGEVAARAAGKPLWQLERELVFDPLGMKDTLRNPPASLIPRIAPTEYKVGTQTPWRGIVHDENARRAEGLTGHAGLFSTGESLAKLATELLRSLDGKGKLMSKEVVVDFTQPHKMGEASHSVRGLGWGYITHDRGNKAAKNLYHNGFTGTSIEIDPHRKIYFILLTNNVHPTRNNSHLGPVRRNVSAAILQALDAAK